MNLKEIKHSIYKESGIFLVIILVFGGVCYFIQNLYGELDNKTHTLEGDAMRLLNERNTLEDHYKRFQTNIDIYQEIQNKAKESGLYIDRQAVWDILNFFKARYYLSSLAADMQGITEARDDPKFVKPNYVVATTNVTVKLEAPSDLDIYDMMRALQMELPGYSKITQFSVAKKSDIDLQSLEKVVTQGASANVTANFTFKWMGLKANDPNSEANKYVPKKHTRRK